MIKVIIVDTGLPGSPKKNLFLIFPYVNGRPGFTDTFQKLILPNLDVTFQKLILLYNLPHQQRLHRLLK